MGIQLAPDVEAALVSEAAARGVPVDGLLREALQAIHLAPDVEAALVSEAAARGMSVDGLLREAWQLYRQRHETPVSPVRRVPYESREQEMAWTREPDRRYLGQWVALQGSRVVASGIDGKVVYKTAREQGVKIPFMFFVAEPDPRPFVGGWLGTE